jgi:hypothetical protein
VEDWLVSDGSNTCTKQGATLAVTMGQTPSVVPALNTANFPGGITGWVTWAWAAMQSIVAILSNKIVLFILVW